MIEMDEAMLGREAKFWTCCWVDTLARSPSVFQESVEVHGAKQNSCLRAVESWEVSREILTGHARRSDPPQ